MSTQQQKPSILNAILLTIPLLVVFFVVGFALVSVLTLIVEILFSIPIISGLLAWLFSVRDDSPSMVIAIIAASVCYYAVRNCAERLCSHLPTRRLLLKITGGSVSAFYAFILLSVLLAYGFGSGLTFPYICFIIAGICLWFASDKYPDPKPAEVPKPTAHEPADTYIYLETEGGMTVRVPEDRLGEYADPNRPKPEITPERRAELKAALKQRIYGGDSNQS